MEISFVRVRGERDRIYVHRSDGSETSWVFASFGDGLPHDLVHLVVESAFGLKQAFWGCVDAGADPGRIAEEANRKGGPDKYRALGDDQRELLRAEDLAGALWLAPAIGAQVAISPAMDPEREAAAQRALAELASRWRAIGAKGTLRLRFWPDDPERTVREI